MVVKNALFELFIVKIRSNSMYASSLHSYFLRLYIGLGTIFNDFFLQATFHFLTKPTLHRIFEITPPPKNFHLLHICYILFLKDPGHSIVLSAPLKVQEDKQHELKWTDRKTDEQADWRTLTRLAETIGQVGLRRYAWSGISRGSVLKY